MRVIRQYYKIESCPKGNKALKELERFGRTCYKSEDKITGLSSINFVSFLVRNGHHSVLEHINLTVRFVTNRGVTHELVRHRLAAYSQESTRYCNYKAKGVVFILPIWFYPGHRGATYRSRWIWRKSMRDSEKWYLQLLEEGWTPQEAREVLPNALKTEIVMTANLREWRHVLQLRTSDKAHPQMKALMLPLLEELRKRIPVVFEW